MRSRHIDKHMPNAIAGSELSLAIRSSRTLDRRHNGRVPFEAMVSYFSCDETGTSRGKGYLKDLSKTGCKIVGTPLHIGSVGTVVIRLDDTQWPLCISGVEVSWASDDSFGVRFPELDAETRHRLQKLVLKFATFKGSSPGYTAFQLA